MTPRTGRRAAVLALVAAAALVLGGCSGDDEKPAKGSATATSAVDVPEGVTLTEAGATLDIGKPATVGYAVGEAASALTVTVTSVKPGRAKDLAGYVLDPASAASTPYFVSVDLRNEGPDPLGGAAVPLYGFDSTDTYFPPTTFAGEPYERCPGGALPKAFGVGASAKACFVLLVPQGATLTSVQLRTEDLAAPVSWPVS